MTKPYEPCIVCTQLQSAIIQDGAFTVHRPTYTAGNSHFKGSSFIAYGVCQKHIYVFLATLRILDVDDFRIYPWPYNYDFADEGTEPRSPIDHGQPVFLEEDIANTQCPMCFSRHQGSC